MRAQVVVGIAHGGGRGHEAASGRRSRCCSAASALGENFSGLLSRVTIIVACARSSRLKTERAVSRSTLPATASCSSWPMSSISSGVRACSGRCGACRPRRNASRELRRCRPADRLGGRVRRPAAAGAEPAAGGSAAARAACGAAGAVGGAAAPAFGAPDHGVRDVALVVPRHHRPGRRGCRRRRRRLDGRRRDEGPVQVRCLVGHRGRDRAGRAAECAQRVGVGRHVRQRGGRVEQRVRQRIAARGRTEAEQLVQRARLPATGTPRFGPSGADGAPPHVQAQPMAARGARRRGRRDRIGRERVPVRRDAARRSGVCGGGRRGRPAAPATRCRAQDVRTGSCPRQAGRSAARRTTVSRPTARAGPRTGPPRSTPSRRPTPRRPARSRRCPRGRPRAAASPGRCRGPSR